MRRARIGLKRNLIQLREIELRGRRDAPKGQSRIWFDLVSLGMVDYSRACWSSGADVQVNEYSGCSTVSRRFVAPKLDNVRLPSYDVFGWDVWNERGGT